MHLVDVLARSMHVPALVEELGSVPRLTRTCKDSVLRCFGRMVGWLGMVWLITDVEGERERERAQSWTTPAAKVA